MWIYQRVTWSVRLDGPGWLLPVSCTKFGNILHRQEKILLQHNAEFFQGLTSQCICSDSQPWQNMINGLTWGSPQSPLPMRRWPDFCQGSHELIRKQDEFDTKPGRTWYIHTISYLILGRHAHTCHTSKSFSAGDRWFIGWRRRSLLKRWIYQLKWRQSLKCHPKPYRYLGTGEMEWLLLYTYYGSL